MSSPATSPPVLTPGAALGFTSLQELQYRTEQSQPSPAAGSLSTETGVIVERPQLTASAGMVAQGPRQNSPGATPSLSTPLSASGRATDDLDNSDTSDWGLKPQHRAGENQQQVSATLSDMQQFVNSQLLTLQQRTLSNATAPPSALRPTSLSSPTEASGAAGGSSNTGLYMRLVRVLLSLEPIYYG